MAERTLTPMSDDEIRTLIDEAEARDNGRRNRPRHPWASTKTNQRRHETREYVNEIKLARGCIDCGYVDHAAALLFVHRPDEHKRFNISQGLDRKRSTLDAEIAKCDTRCANCHAIRITRLGPRF